MGRRHGGRGHQVSRQTVRQRRVAGIKPKRGHNFDRRLRNERTTQLQAAEAKVYDESMTEIVARLVGRFGIGDRLREDMEQEIWVRLLEGQTEAEVSDGMRGIKASVSDIELGPFRQMSLDAPVGKFADESGYAFADMVDQDGRVMGGQAPLDAEVRWTPDARQHQRAQAHLAKEQAKAERMVAREVARAAKSLAREAAVERERVRVFWARELESAARACVSLVSRAIGNVQRERVRAELEVARAEFRAQRDLRRLAFDWNIAHPDHGQKHKDWWAAHPEAKDALVERTQRVRAVKGDEIAAKLSQKGQEWWDAHPEERARRGEAMRQAWVRRKARETGTGAAA